MATFLFFICVLVGYLFGSVCSAVIVCRIFSLPDPRIEGSRNPGATNVLRIAGKQYAIIVLIADVLKGLLPVLLAKLLGVGQITLGFTALAAVLGHMYPIFFGFQGGKGVATALGAFLGLHFMLGILVIATWLIVANVSRYSSLASMVAITLAPFFSIYAYHSADAFLPLMAIAFFVLYQHRQNMNRLMDGTEPKINFRKNAAEVGVAVNDSLIHEEIPIAEEPLQEIPPVQQETKDAVPKSKPVAKPRKAKATSTKTPAPSKKKTEVKPKEKAAKQEKEKVTKKNAPKKTKPKANETAP